MYEYQILNAKSLINAEQLNELAIQGWRLITIAQMNGKFYFYFERPVMN